MADRITLRHAHLFCGDGGGAAGFNRGQVRVGELEARFECLGGIDADPVAIRDFTRFAGVQGTCLDLFDRTQYRDFHGHEPPADWREAGSDDIRRAFQNERPDIAFTSPPCKGLSSLQNKRRSESAKYQALNRLTVRGIRLLLEAYEDDPIPLILLENVPRIQTRGRALVDDIVHELDLAGYATAETIHDCGELGGLAQHRPRFLLVARHRARVRPFVYVPPKRRVRGVGEVLGELPMPSAVEAGPMHRLPRLTWKTALRLALIPAGKDWRALESIDFGALRIVPGGAGDYHRGVLGVLPWDAPAGTVAAGSRAMNGAYSVADPRQGGGAGWHGLGVVPWDRPAPTVTTVRAPGQGNFSVADVRLPTGYTTYGVFRVIRWDEPSGAVSAQSEPGTGGYTVADVRADGVRQNNVFRVVDWTDPAQAVTAGMGPSSGGQAVADVRMDGLPSQHAQMRVVDWERPSPTVTSGPHVQSGALSVADVRVGMKRGRAFETGKHFGVVPWEDPAGVVASSACHDNGANSVADPRPPELHERTGAVIIALDGTWHRPFTTLELAVLQGHEAADLMVQPLAMPAHTRRDENHNEWREHIGNRVPVHSATAIAEVFGEALLRHRLGEGWRLDTREVWVRRLLAAVAVPT